MSEQILVIVFMLGILGLFVVLIRSAMNYRRRQIERLQRMGFTEVRDPDETLLRQLSDVVQPGPKRTSIGTLFRRAAGYYEMYTFLPRQQEGREADFVVRVPGLTLPKIRIMRKVPLGGKLGAWLNAMASKVAGMGLAPVELPQHPELAESYMIFSNSPPDAAELIAQGWLDLLRDAPVGFAVSGEGEVLAFAFNEQMERAQRKKKRPAGIPDMTGIPGAEEQRFQETVRRVERFVEAARGQ